MAPDYGVELAKSEKGGSREGLGGGRMSKKKKEKKKTVRRADTNMTAPSSRQPRARSGLADGFHTSMV